MLFTTILLGQFSVAKHTRVKISNAREMTNAAAASFIIIIILRIIITTEIDPRRSKSLNTPKLSTIILYNFPSTVRVYSRNTDPSPIILRKIVNNMKWISARDFFLLLCSYVQSS